MVTEFWGLPFLPSYDVGSVRGVLTLLIVILAMGFLVHVAAKMMVKKDDVHMGIVAAVVGILLAHLAFNLVTPSVAIVGILLAIVAFIASIAAVYRTKLAPSVAVGAVAWVLWIVLNIAMRYVQDHWRS